MKDATGELSMTAIAVVAIAAIAVVFTTLIWPAIKSNITRSTKCAQSFACGDTNSNGMRECSYCSDADESCETPEQIMCPDEAYED